MKCVGRSTALYLASLLGVILLPIAYATAQSIPPVSSPAHGPNIVKELPMPLTGSLFLESKNYTSQLYLVNQLDFGVNADVTLYDMSGSILVTSRRYIGPNSPDTISIQKVLSDAGMFASIGSVEVVSPDNSAALLGQLSITRNGAKKAYLDQELFMPSHGASSTLRAVIDSPANSPIVAVTNTSSKAAQTLTISCIRANGTKVVSKTVSLDAKQTRLVTACNEVLNVASSPDAADEQFLLTGGAARGMAGQDVAGISITGNGIRVKSQLLVL